MAQVQRKEGRRVTFPKKPWKKAKKSRKRTHAMTAYMILHPFCEARLTVPSTECHHIVSRRRKNTDDPSVFLALSHDPHAEYHRSWRQFIEDYPHLADKVLAARRRFNLKDE